MKTDPDILSLLKSSNARDRDYGFVLLYRNYFKVIKNFVINHHGSILDAEDLFQDGIIVLYAQCMEDTFELTCTVQTYLYSICKNLWFKKLRDHKGIHLVIEEEEIVPVESSHLELVIQSEEKKLLMEMVDELGKKCKTLLVLFYFENLSLKEIAKRIGYKNYTVVKNLKSRCMRKLRKLAYDSDIFREFIKH